MACDQIFISYSHDDERWKNRLVSQLGVLEYEGLLSVWEDRQIAAGDDWLPEIEAAIQSCGVALLLISAQFLTSKFIRGKEVPALLQRRQQGGVRIIPVILKPCAWTRVSWLKLIQARPKDGKPLSGMSEHDAEAALAVLAEEVADLLAGGVRAPIFVSNSHRKPALPAIKNIHGWLPERVQALQQQTAQVLGLSVEFCDGLEGGGQGPRMVVIPGGRFLMGSPSDELERRNNERQHEVEVTPFAIGKYVVTFEEYDRFTGATGRKRPDDEGWGRGRRPVVNVDWSDAVAYTQWLSEQTGQRYWLPTEAEWEYACRAGTTTPFYFGETINTDQANYNGNHVYGKGRKGVYRQKTVEVGQFPANAWGLHDMHGNVWEWTCSVYDEEYGGGEQCCTEPGTDSPCVLRGGSWPNGPDGVRASGTTRTSGSSTGVFAWPGLSLDSLFSFPFLSFFGGVSPHFFRFFRGYPTKQ
jgi:formylglycine-generating enzyme required for sulfatase activity